MTDARSATEANLSPVIVRRLMAKGTADEAIAAALEGKDVLDALADMIEPQECTCHLVRHGHPTAGPEGYVLEHVWCISCSECSFGWFWDEYDLPPSYCPHCGARIEEVCDGD